MSYFNGVICPICDLWDELLFKPGRQRWVTCARGHRFDAFVVLGREGGRKRKGYSPEELARRSERLARARALRWPATPPGPVKSPALPATGDSREET
jgi:hypothetical protein